MAATTDRAHFALVSAATNYDTRLTKRDGNIHRLGLIFRGLERMKDEKPCCYAHGLYDNFSDRILTAFEKALGLAVTYGNGRSERRPTTCSNGERELVNTP